jgi:alpha-N-acetylglucosamine transferase
VTRDNLLVAINSFFTIITPLLEEQFVSLIVKVQVKNGPIRSITRLITFNLKDYDKIIYVILEY